MTLDENVAAKEEQEYESPPLPETPRKRTKDQPMGSDTPSKKTKSNSSSKRSNPLGPIPSSYNDASDIDKLIIDMKEKQGKSWAEIRDAVEQKGVKTVGSTVQVRYTRMKSNFVVFEPEDGPLLREVKRQIEDEFEAEKWQKMASAFEARTGRKYPVSAVQKKIKEMSKLNA